MSFKLRKDHVALLAGEMSMRFDVLRCQKFEGGSPLLLLCMAVLHDHGRALKMYDELLKTSVAARDSVILTQIAKLMHCRIYTMQPGSDKQNPVFMRCFDVDGSERRFFDHEGIVKQMHEEMNYLVNSPSVVYSSPRYLLFYRNNIVSLRQPFYS